MSNRNYVLHQHVPVEQVVKVVSSSCVTQQEVFKVDVTTLTFVIPDLWIIVVVVATTAGVNCCYGDHMSLFASLTTRRISQLARE